MLSRKVVGCRPVREVDWCELDKGDIFAATSDAEVDDLYMWVSSVPHTVDIDQDKEYLFNLATGAMEAAEDVFDSDYVEGNYYIYNAEYTRQ